MDEKKSIRKIQRIDVGTMILNNSNEHSDKLLVLKLREGNVLAFEQLFNRYQSKLINFIRSALSNETEAEEIAQEVFLKIWEKRTGIDPNRSFKSFLYTVTKNEIHDYLRKVLQQKKYVERTIHELAIADNDLEQIVDFRETDKVIKELVNLLPGKRRKVFELSRFHGKTYRQIALEMNISENTVDTQMRKALAFLKEGITKISTCIFFL